jgi:redox-sensitive bicupin YhaK (pirin superfamily)
VNLPAAAKMDAPRYQEFAPDRIPAVAPARGVAVKVIAGSIVDAAGQTIRGPIEQPATDPLYLDIALEPGAGWQHLLPAGHNAFAYVYEGQVQVGEGEDARELLAHELGVLGGGDALSLHGGSEGARLILVAGRPLREPVARHGPFVMNTREEVMQAFVDFQEGRF